MYYCLSDRFSTYRIEGSNNSHAANSEGLQNPGLMVLMRWGHAGPHARLCNSFTDISDEQTMFLCVWQAIHLNIPPPGEPPSKQNLRRAGWSILAIIAPEIVALNAWTQYDDARCLVKTVNHLRGLASKSRNGRLRALGGHLLMLCVAPLRIADYLRMLLWFQPDLRTQEREERQSRNDKLLSQLDNDELPWTMDTAYYALCGGAIVVSDYGMGDTLAIGGVYWLAKHHPKFLIPLQRAALQDPSKASGLAKLIVCIQALWFCSQCIARLSQNLALSLIELNTFAHCVSALCIYNFWWHKPYDVQTHVHINDLAIYHEDLMRRATRQMRGKSANVFFLSERDANGAVTLISPQMVISSVSQCASTIGLGHVIKDKGIIPGTGFTISRKYWDSEPNTQTYFVPEASLILWTQLWNVRTACGHSIDRLPGPSADIHHEFPSNLCVPRIRNWNKTYFSDDDRRSLLAPLMMILTSFSYGAMHLLAWQYHFSTATESTIWRFASAATASSGFLSIAFNFRKQIVYVLVIRSIRKFVVLSVRQYAAVWDISEFVSKATFRLLCLVAVLSRSHLFIESFRALPNSPVSIYEVPRWTAYIPHI